MLGDRGRPKLRRIVMMLELREQRIAGRAARGKAAQLVAAECVVLAETKDHTNWELIGELAPRLLRDVCGVEVRDLPEGEVCCGFGGSFSMDHPGVARAIVARKLDNVAQTGATVLVTDNPGCLLHLRGAADARGMRLRLAHVAEILAERLG